MTALVFVYGTLLPCFDNPVARQFHESAKRIGEARLRAKLYFVAGYPGVVEADCSNSVVHGTVYRIAEHGLFDLLDRYEGCIPKQPEASEYIRRQVSVMLQDEKTISVWVYFYNRSTRGAEPILGGCYRTWYAQRQRANP